MEEREFANERRFDISETDMDRYFSLLGETVNLLKACANNATFEDAIICIIAVLHVCCVFA